VKVSAVPGSVAVAVQITLLPASAVVVLGVRDTIVGGTLSALHEKTSVAVPPFPSEAVTVTDPFPSSSGTLRHDHRPLPWSVTAPAPAPVIVRTSPSGSLNDPCVTRALPSLPDALAPCSCTTGDRFGGVE
jgi:hypothetical protein